MSQEKKSKFEAALLNEVTTIDKNYLRGIKKEMYDCCSNCCCDKQGSIADVDRCLVNCQVKYNSCQNYVATQLRSFQERVERCLHQCNDEAKDRLGLSPTDSEVQKVTQLFDKCAGECLDKHVDSLSVFRNKIHQFFAQQTGSADKLDL